MPLVTTIRWRPYPKEKPERSAHCWVLLDDEIGVSRREWLGKRWAPHPFGSEVTHFALIEDIETREER